MKRDNSANENLSFGIIRYSLFVNNFLDNEAGYLER